MEQTNSHKVGREPYAIRPSLLLLTPLLFALCGGTVSNAALAADASPTPAAASSTPAGQPSPTLAPQALGELGNLIAAGKLPGLRWPTFTDFQAEVVKFYGLSANALAWLHDGQPTAQAQAMIRLFKQASLKGLNPDDYDASRWDDRLAKLAPSNPHPADTDLAHFDLALTVCAERYLSALRVGRVDPQHFEFGLDVGPRRYGLSEFLRYQVIEAPDVDAEVASLEPHYEGYGRAETALATYVKLAAQGDGAPLPLPGKSVHPGDTYTGVAPLISHLRQLGDLGPDAAAPADTTVYQGAAVDGVKHFQKRNGLQPDGVLGKETVGELNVPLSQRVKQLQLALERYRWIPPNFPQPPIIVNLPQFKLRTMRRQPAPFLTMRVIVGKAYGHQTPIFADYMRYLIFRPYWEVPMSIQFAELIPKIRRDPNYLADHGFEVTTSSGTVVTDGVVSDDILSKLRSGSLSIRQKPGPKNALGLVKFIFPNHYNVYLHSTPEPELFLKARRDFSHGCIRVQNPEGLAAWVLRDKPEWTAEKIHAAMNGDQTIQVNLDKPIPVLILYTTAVVEPDGAVRFFRDIYKQDSELDKALASGYPYPS
ncbi:MAG: L,D-transpeptidase family protein [Candidatus Binataceae bacterium]